LFIASSQIAGRRPPAAREKYRYLTRFREISSGKYHDVVQAWHHGGMDADQLHGLPLDRFVPERAALTRALRAEGRREEAAEVAGLRKPSVAAWAVNQLVRTQVQAVGELFDAGDALREAQARLLSGQGDRDALRATAKRERAAVDALVSTARGLLTSQGHELSAATIERVTDTLHAAALDDDARARVRDGRLERELRRVGFGVGEGAGTASVPPAAKRQAPAKHTGAKEAAPPARREPATTAREERAARERAARERAARARAEAQRIERERAQAREAARAAESEARRLAERAAHALHLAEERRRRALLTLHDADEAVASARREADATAAAHDRARQETERMEAER
jgi:hypothetical protein